MLASAYEQQTISKGSRVHLIVKTSGEGTPFITIQIKKSPNVVSGSLITGVL